MLSSALAFLGSEIWEKSFKGWRFVGLIVGGLVLLF